MPNLIADVLRDRDTPHHESSVSDKSLLSQVLKQRGDTDRQMLILLKEMSSKLDGMPKTSSLGGGV